MQSHQQPTRQIWEENLQLKLMLTQQIRRFEHGYVPKFVLVLRQISQTLTISVRPPQRTIVKLPPIHPYAIHIRGHQ
jgi:hypothetical protein